MSRGYNSLIEASVDLDFSELESRLDDLEGSVSESAIAELVSNSLDNSDFESRIASLESLNTCGVDLNDLADIPARVGALESSDLDLSVESLIERVKTLEQRNGELERGLGEWRATDLAALGERIERLEYTSNVSYNFFALAGKMVSLLLNGPRS